MKLVSISLKNIKKPIMLRPIITDIIKKKPDVVVVLNYRREFQEEILHPLQKYMHISKSESTDDYMIIWKEDIRHFFFDIKNTSSFSLLSFEVSEGETKLIKSLLPRE